MSSKHFVKKSYIFLKSTNLISKNKNFQHSVDVSVWYECRAPAIYIDVGESAQDDLRKVGWTAKKIKNIISHYIGLRWQHRRSGATSRNNK